MRKHVAAIGLIALVMIEHNGCVTFGKSEASSFFILTSLAPASESEGSSQLVIGVLPVTIPDYLNRPEIVTRPSRHEVSVANFNRWAQPLDENMSRVLEENLAALKSTTRVVGFPWHPATKIDYEVEVDVIHFESVDAGDVRLAARWIVLKGDGETVVTSRDSRITKSCEGADAAAIVAAMSDALGDLSREIAAAIPETS